MQTDDDPIAVVGFSLRFPQDADSTESFWEMLSQGKNAMTDFPSTKFNIDAFHGRKGAMNGTMPLRGGHFLNGDLGLFDAPFFSITPAEAEAMDPQQRIMLETSYRALENSGIPITRCRGSRTSVYTATFTDDYKSVLMDAPDNLPQCAATGLSGSMLANRISWFYDFKGPSMNLDSACSSSLSALHIACGDLHNGTSQMALVGGCNLVFHPDFMLIMSNMGFLSSDSRCQSFDHKANGYARGDGFGVVVLKKLSAAVKDGDTIRAVIRATGLNQDGRTPGGITQPSGVAQQALIEETFARARLDMRPVRFFEAHGTGTALGDPTEAGAIGRSFREFRSDEEPLYVGAVKSNIGHLEGGSGMAGLLKTILMLERGVILPNAGLEKVNPRIDTKNLRIRFPTVSMPWPDSGLRRACVNSFGFGGSNAVVVLDDALHYLEERGIDGLHRTTDMEDIEYERPLKKPRLEGPSRSMDAVQPPQLMVWSAADETTLNTMLDSFNDFVRPGKRQASPSSLIPEMAYTLTAKRTNYAWRSYAVTDNSEDLGSLEKWSAKPTKANSEPGSLAFVFTGQGAQYPKMGHGLLAFPFFQSRLTEIEKILHGLGYGCSLREFLSNPSSPMNEPEHSQTVTTAIQIAIVDFLKSVNVVPAAVVGHSSGEIAAAYCAGVISDVTALTIAFHRGRIAQKLPKLHSASQGMLAVAMSEPDIKPFIDRLSEYTETPRVQIGCHNSPQSLTLTGDADQLALIQDWLEEGKHFCRKLRVNVAYHSVFMEAVKEEYRLALSHIDRDPVQHDLIPMISSVTGTIARPRMLCDPDYWVQNLVSQVRFSPAVSLLAVQSGKPPRIQLTSRKPQTLSGINMLVEIGPHSTLQGPLKEILTKARAQDRLNYTATLNRQKDASRAILEAVGRLWGFGYPVNLLKANGIDNATPRPVRTDLPEYPFNHSKSYWFEDRQSSAFRFRKHLPHELLGTLTVDSTAQDSRWRNIIDLEKLPWLEDHQISGDILLPGAAMLSMAIEGVRQLYSSSDITITGFDIRDVHFLNALQVPPASPGIETQVSLTKQETRNPHAQPWYKFRILTYTSEWLEHCRGSIRPQVQAIDPARYNAELLSIIRSCTEDAQITRVYNSIRDNGVNYGPIFQTLSDVRIDKNGAAVAQVRPFSNDARIIESANVDLKPYVMHPSVLDGLFQLVFPALNEGGARDIPAMVPSYVRKLFISADASSSGQSAPLRASTRSALNGFRGTQSNVVVMSEGGDKVLSYMDGYQTTFVSQAEGLESSDDKDRHLLSYLKWQPDVTLMDNEQLAQLCAQATPKPDSTLSGFDSRLSLLMRSYVHEIQEALHPSWPDGIPKQLAGYITDETHVKDSENAIMRPKTNGIHDPSTRVALEEEIRAANKTGEFYVSRGQQLLNFLQQGTTFSHPESQESQDETIQAYLNERLASEHLGKPLEAFLSALAHKNPLMKILDIGGGWQDTAPCAEILSKSGQALWAQYDYTERGPEDLKRAEERLSGLSDRVQFQVLDIENDPVDQGFDDGSYDIVVATSLLHSTPDLSNALRNIRRLLKPGGHLILFGVIASPQLRTVLATTLLSTWGRAPNSGRPLGGSYSKDSLHRHLTENAYNGLDFIITGSSEHCDTSFVVASANDATPRPKEEVPSRLAILTDGVTSSQQIFAARLKMHIETTAEGVQVDIYTFSEFVSTADAHGRFCISLLEYEQPFFADIGSEDFDRLKTALSITDAILWVTRDAKRSDSPEYHLVDGFSRSLRSENGTLKFVRLALDGSLSKRVDDGLGSVMTVLRQANSSALDEMEFEYEERDGFLQIPRVVQTPDMNKIHEAKITPFQEQEVQVGNMPLTAVIKTPGIINSIGYEETGDSDADGSLEADEILIEVQAVGVCVEDYNIALGRNSDEAIFSECAGIVRQVGSHSGFTVGDKVFARTPGACTTGLKCKASCAARLPAGSVSFLEAAALPTAGVTALHALTGVANLSGGETVLVHHAASSVGQIAVQIAQHLGARVIATVDSEDESTLLRETYQIEANCVLARHDPELPQRIATLTSRGVDVALNFEQGDDLDHCIEALAPFGRLVNVGLARSMPSDHLVEEMATKCLTNSTFNLSSLQRHRPLLVRKHLESLASLISSGAVKGAAPPLAFPAAQLDQALQQFQKGQQNMGKVVLDLRPKQTVTARVRNRPSYTFDANATYVIAGGFGGLGRNVCRWMVSRGARNLMIFSRSGVRTQSSRQLIEELTASGASVQAPVCDITQAEDLQRVLAQYGPNMPRIRGCIQCTMVLRDAIFTNMTHSDFITGTHPKTHGSWNLHAQLPSGMDFFILFSSVGGILGATSQANYCAGNTYKDALARYRTRLGEKAISIDLGMMVSEGVVAETDGMLDSLRRLGYFKDVSPTDLLALLDHYCDPTRPIPSPHSDEAQIVVGIENPAGMARKGLEVPHWMSRPFFKHFQLIQAAGQSSGGGSGKTTQQQPDVQSILQQSPSVEEAGAHIAEWLVKKLSQILGIPVAEISPHKPIHVNGINSLVAVELRNWFEKRMGADIAVFEILGSMAITQLSLYAAEKTRFRQGV
ncbi:type I polyketide synthase [Aspergillus melleus]|uniref:type I polyketide synthase n=1 Tax=Aspergillus melleus TaxID=138277 RepID=UPI001E8DEABB|nr:uncharacterized protein LDX57_007512 [Aspergillus melleus]KAH8429841.1 hypothetical protein LDX57_007512 [Aspergillus melleus]